MTAAALFLLLALTGCQSALVINIGGTVNLIPVAKANDGGDMVSTTEAREQNPAETNLKIPVTP